jgi:predicted amidohydrolase
MDIRIAQFRVGRDIRQNKQAILEALETVESGEWIVFPEGAVTGYFPEADDYLEGIASDDVDAAIEEICDAAVRNECNCLFGSATYWDGDWYNSVVVQSRLGPRHFYHKTNLYAPGLRYFRPGNELPVFTIDGVTFGIQTCREIFFPEQWKVLKKKGAEIIFHINNAIKRIDSPWNHLLISRAIENQSFVCSVNNAAEPQALASYLISPSGEVLLQTDLQTDHIVSGSIDLSEVQHAFIDDERTDLVRLQFK